LVNLPKLAWLFVAAIRWLDREAEALRAKPRKNALPTELVRVSIRRVDAALITPASFARMKTLRDSTLSHLGRRG
jgi:hypothetical protein